MRKIWMMMAAAAVLAWPASAQAADTLKKLSGKLEKGLKGEPARKVAVLSFPYTDGSATAGSKIVQERLTTFLAEAGTVQVIERQLLEKILDEKKLAQTGILDPKTSAELGRVLGVNALVTGTLNDLGGGRTEINARAIETDSGRILSAGQAVIPTSWSRPAATQLADDSKAPRGKNLAQLAILIDTSNSMDGLISQAKSQLWRIVNEIASAKKGGEAPNLQVAVYQYGNNGLSPTSQFVQQLVPFTADLDRVSKALFSLSTNGGEEYAGAAIGDAVRELSWTAEPGAYKAIFIAGNEPFAQGSTPFREAIASAVRKGVVVNTVYCGPRDSGVREDWLAGAQAGGGEFLVIDQDQRVAAISAPQDAEIGRLSMKLNDTFIPLGARGRMAKREAEEQDKLAGGMGGGVAAERAAFKAKAQYARGASAWDAVSQVVSGAAAPAAVAAAPKESLPDEMRDMDEQERVRYVENKAKDRREIQEKISRLETERAAYLKKAEKDTGSTLGGAVVDAVRKQAAKKGYHFKS
ncbi:MAG: VWA domain-containing protein [Elusimicrobia bacterium]|nr:VWA domain-containing protein [Elusimicrobiota bacterium]